MIYSTESFLVTSITGDSTSDGSPRSNSIARSSSSSRGKITLFCSMATRFISQVGGSNVRICQRSSPCLLHIYRLSPEQFNLRRRSHPNYGSSRRCSRTAGLTQRRCSAGAVAAMLRVHSVWTLPGCSASTSILKTVPQEQ